MTPAELLILSRLRVTPVQLVLEAVDPWNGPRWKGLLLRSAVGFHLRQRECLTGAPTCAGCGVAADCWYAYAFETPASLASAPGLRHADLYRPHPYFLSAAPAQELELRPGATLPCLLTLMGASEPSLVRLAGALDLAGRSGRWGGRFRIARMTSPLDPRVELPVKDPPDCAAAVHWPAWKIPDESGARAIRIQTIAPLRLRRRGTLIRKPAFGDIIQALTRRVHLLAQTFAELDLPPGWADELLERANGTRLLRAEWEYDCETRFSGRQKQRIPLDGVMGTLEVSGDLGPLWAYLDLARWIGIGSSTSHGFGSVHVSVQR